MRAQIRTLAVLLCLTGCTNASDKHEDTEPVTDSSEDNETGEETGEGTGEDTGEECPGGAGEPTCCEEGTPLCGTSLTGEKCCDNEGEYCATCNEQGDEVTTCLPVGEECEDPGEEN